MSQAAPSAPAAHQAARRSRPPVTAGVREDPPFPRAKDGARGKWVKLGLRFPQPRLGAVRAPRAAAAFLAGCVAALVPYMAAADPAYTFDAALDARYRRFRRPASPAGLRDLVLVGAAVRGAVGGEAVGYRAGLDTHLGAAWQGGFAYDASLLPVGIAAPLSSPLRFGLSGGVGLNGVTSHLPASMLLPAELVLHADLGYLFAVEGWVRAAWATASSRQGPPGRVASVDDLETGLLLRFGKAGTCCGMHWGNGTFVAASYGERVGIPLVSVSIGHSLDFVPAE